MTHYLHEYMVRESLRRAEETDRELERWGWFRAIPAPPSRRGPRIWIGRALVRLGLRLQGAAS
jgi:hypothetical protein